MGGFGDNKVATLRYMSSRIDLNPGIAGVAASHVFTGNGVYDPDITGTGHQPLGFDQWMGLYNHFTVTGFTMKVYFDNHTSTGHPCFCGIKVTPDGAVITNGQETIEQGNCVWKLVSGAGDNSMQMLTLTQDNSKYFSKSVLNERDFQGSNSGNPLEQLYPTIFAFTNDTSDGAVVECHVIIDYRVVFTEPKLVNQS